MKSTYRYPLFLLSTFFFFFFFYRSNAMDTLTRGQSIKDGQTLVSAGGVFELGFFSPGNSTYRYIGIWYHNISTQTIVWVANRATPLTNTTGSLTIGTDGNLVLVDDENNTIWSTNSPNLSNTSTTKAQLLDSGSLVLKSAVPNETVLWNSFDHPTDTFIPGMRVSLDKRTGKRTIYRSWKSPNDPSPGKYSLGLDPSGSAQLFIWKKRKPWWRSGQWDGTKFIGSTMRALYLYGFKLVNDGRSMYFTFTPFNSTQLRFALQWDGVENTSLLVGNTSTTKHWVSVWVQPVNECETYGKCGNYGICSESGAPMCGCLEGFEPESDEEWSKGNWSGGCVRSTPLSCRLNSSSSNGSKADGFYGLQGVKVPDFSDWASTVVNEVDCRSACLQNCSCKAYAYVTGIGCLIWGTDLIDIYQFPEGGDNGSNLFIKLAGSELRETKSKKWRLYVILASSVVFLLIVCIFLWWKYNAKIKDWWKKDKNRGGSSMVSVDSRREATPEFSGPSEGREEVQEGEATELPLFSFDSMVTATNNFSDSNKLGEGGFGDVYKGMLPGGQEVAIKRLSRFSGQGQGEFKNEMTLIAKLQHRNLVRLLGCCIQREEKMLIYEYMPNKSLDVFLFDVTKQVLLDWKKRFDIIEGIARGLVYLHRDSRLRIVHRDLKASNILLDSDMNPKISDFGMARIFGNDQNQDNTNRVVGTFGYMSPEYAMEGLFSVKSDVYSFGILVLEIVSGRKNNSFRDMEDAINIVGYGWQLWNEDRAIELIDPTIISSCPIPKVLRCIQVALLCVQDRANDRPDMPSVVLMLGSETPGLPVPRQPTYTSEGSPNGTGMMTTRNETHSINDVTITVLLGR